MIENNEQKTAKSNTPKCVTLEPLSPE